jgi:hypothetical protein
MTPAERQAKCRAIKRGEWHTIPGTPVDRPPELPPPTGRTIAALPSPAAPAGQSVAALPPPGAPRALPAPAVGPVMAMQKATPAAAPEVPDAGTPGDALRLSLPPAVAARLRSLLERQGAAKPLTAAERAEAQGLLDIAEFFVVQRLRLRFAA